MRDHLNKLENDLKKLKVNLEAKQGTHKTAVLDKQEMLQHQLNKLSSKELRVNLSPRRKDDMENQRSNYS